MSFLCVLRGLCGETGFSDGTRQLTHFFYAAGWKKFEPLWDVVIRARQLRIMTPLLEGVLSRVTANEADSPRNFSQSFRPNAEVAGTAEAR